MGVHFLVRNLQSSNARLPLKITFNEDVKKSDFECEINIEKYREMGSGELKSIGIDGSVFIHAYIVSEKYEVEKIKYNNNDYIIVKNKQDDITYSVNIEASVNRIITKVMEYVMITTIFFRLFNDNNEQNEQNEQNENPKSVLLHFVMDGKPPVSKNRDVHRSKDIYSVMSNSQKKVLHSRIIDKLEKEVTLFNRVSEKYTLILLSNERCGYKTRGEGELALYSLCSDINKKYNFDKSLRHVIVSPDSDVTAIMILNTDPTMVIISPPSGVLSQIYISSHKLICDGLNLSASELIVYTILHFIFFGSDYNLGLVNNPCVSKQKIIYDSVKKNERNLNEIGKKFRRCVSKDSKNKLKKLKQNSLLSTLKDLLVTEGLCAIMYYKSLGNKSYLLDHSPLLYADLGIKQYVSLLPFE